MTKDLRMDNLGAKGAAIVASLEADSYTTNRRSGDNPMGISVRHPLLGDRVLVCHIHVDKSIDEVIGFYFNCVRDVKDAMNTAALAGVELECCHAIKRGETDPYVTSKLKRPVSVNSVLALVRKALDRVPVHGIPNIIRNPLCDEKPYGNCLVSHDT
jgi:hypothetical protein